MQTLKQRMFLRFFLCRNTGVRHVPAKAPDNVVPIRPSKPALRIGTEVRDGGFQYVKVLPNEPRTA